MIKELKKHKIGYTVLTLILFIFALAFLHLWPDRNKQRLLTIVMGIFYFFWGIIVHIKADHINKKIVFEYLAMSLLASSILILLTI